MTENRRSKRAIRARMTETGEKYTDARRALLGSEREPGDGARAGRVVNVAHEYLAEAGAHWDKWESERAAATLAAAEAFPDDLRAADLFHTAAQPVMRVVIKLAAKRLPGADPDTDADWAATLAVTKRDLLTLRRSGIDPGLVDGHLGLIDIIESRIGRWPEAHWRQAVRDRVQALVDARDRGRRRGERLAKQAASVAGADLVTAAWVLRHPADHYFAKVRATMTDPALVAYLDQQIAATAPSYAALAARDWSAEMAKAELVIELQISEPVPPGWEQPVPTTVIHVHRGTTPTGARIGLRLVADPDAGFNGTLLSLLGGERWLVCGSLLDDGTLCPCDGTRRLPAG